MDIAILVGIQASGKSSFYKKSLVDTHVRINSDLLGTANKQDAFVTTCVLTKTSFAVDKTNTSLSSRTRYIEVAKFSNYKVTGYVFCVPLDIALERNNKRPEKTKVPERGVIATYKGFIPPHFSEGFDSIYYVIPNGGTFRVIARPLNSDLMTVEDELDEIKRLGTECII